MSVDSQRDRRGIAGRRTFYSTSNGGIVRLTDTAARAFTSAERKRLEASVNPQKLSDGEGLLIVSRAVAVDLH